MLTPTHWALPALLAPLLWAASNLIDERLVNETPLDAWALVLITGLFASIPTLTFLVGWWSWPGAPTAGLAFLTGAVGVLVYFPYLRALSHEAASSVLLMWNLTPVLILVLARVGVAERLLPAQYVAIMLLVTSSLVAAYRRDTDARWSGALPWMAVASVLLASASVLEKAVFQRMDFAHGLPWISVGALMTTVAVGFTARRSRRLLQNALHGRLGAVLIANEGLDLGAAWSLGLATSLGPVSLVHAVGGVQPLFVLLLDRLTRQRGVARGEGLRTALAAGLAVAGLALLNTSS